MLLGIPGEYYERIYIAIVGIITIFISGKYVAFGDDRFQSEVSEDPTPSLVLAFLVTLFIGFRPAASCFMDMLGYVQGIEQHLYDNMDVSTNFLFDRLRRFASRQLWNKYEFIVLIAFIYYFGMWAACRIMFKRDTMLAFLVCLAAFSTFSYGTNGIKAGSAMAFFLIALALHDTGKKWQSWLFLVISLGFHHSMQLPIIAFFICCFIKKPKWYLFFWIACFFMALFHITFFQFLFAGWTDAQGANYLIEESGQQWGKLGFRLDFVLYSMAPIVVGWLVVFRNKINDPQYEFLLNLYTFLNAIWMLCMYANFTNRIAYLSWGLYPIVLIYPFLRFNWMSYQYGWTKKVSIYHWLFTFFMSFVYYIFIEV